MSRVSGNSQATTCFVREKGHCPSLGLRFLYDRPPLHSSIPTYDLLSLYYCTSLWGIVNTEVNVRFGEMETTYFQLFLNLISML